MADFVPATDPGMTPIEVVIDVFGGIRTVARILDLAPSTVMRWGHLANGRAREHGNIPQEYMRPLLDAAARQALRLTLEEVVWGRPLVHRTIVTFEPASAIGHMAKTLTRHAA